MATHSSNLAWKIPWTEGPSRLQSSHSVQSCLTLFDPVDCSLPWTTVHGVAKSQTRLSGQHFATKVHGSLTCSLGIPWLWVLVP